MCLVFHLDFGMVQHLNSGDHAQSFRGSPLYMVSVTVRILFMSFVVLTFCKQSFYWALGFNLWVKIIVGRITVIYSCCFPVIYSSLCVCFNHIMYNPFLSQIFSSTLLFYVLVAVYHHICVCLL